LTFSKLESNTESALKYMQVGGFPEYLKTNNPLVLHHLWDDILYRDIAVRYGVRDVQTLRKLAIYLLSNIGKTYSANKLSALFQFKSVSTLLEYISHLENAYLVASVPMFSYSLKAQVRNPKKVYTIDLGLFTNLSIVFTEENGRRLENLVFLHLRRSYSQIYYFQEKHECDFIVFEKEQVKALYQVCFDFNFETQERELNGAYEAMKFFDLKKAVIVTVNQADVFTNELGVVELVPLHKFLTERP
jgi:predicted AAA+ superfamily ATPase